MRKLSLSLVALGTLSAFYIACGGDDTSGGDGTDAGGLDATATPDGTVFTEDGSVVTTDSGVATDSGSVTDASTTDSGDADAGPVLLPPPPTNGLSIWLAGDNGIATDGGSIDAGDAGAFKTVSTWLDKSDAGNDVTQLDPTLQPALVPGAVNSKPALRFNQQKLVGTSTTQWDYGVNDVTWFYVAKSTDLGLGSMNSNRVFGTLVNAGPFSGLLAGVGTGGQPYAGYRFNADNFVVDPTSAKDKWVIIDSSRVGAVMELYRNGVLVGAPGGGNVDVQGDAITIGAERTGGVEYFTGDIAEVLVYSRALSANERHTTENYLSQKYGFGFHQCANVTGSLISWYKAESNTTDATANNNGTAVGTVNYVSGVNGNAFSFPASGYVEAPDSATLHPTTSFTLEAWISADALGGRIIDKITAGGGDGYLLDTNAGKLRMIVGNQLVSSTNVLPTGSWAHVVGVFVKTGAGAGTVTLYVNGAVNGTTAVAVDAAPTSANKLRIGADSAGGSQFSGRIDDARIWNRALTANEIASIYASGPAGKCP